MSPEASRSATRAGATPPTTPTRDVDSPVKAHQRTGLPSCDVVRVSPAAGCWARAHMMTIFVAWMQGQYKSFQGALLAGATADHRRTLDSGHVRNRCEICNGWRRDIATVCTQLAAQCSLMAKRVTGEQVYYHQNFVLEYYTPYHANPICCPRQQRGMRYGTWCIHSVSSLE